MSPAVSDGLKRNSAAFLESLDDAVVDHDSDHAHSDGDDRHADQDGPDPSKANGANHERDLNGSAWSRQSRVCANLNHAIATAIQLPMPTAIGEVKARADGFREQYRWLEERDVLIVNAARQEPLPKQAFFNLREKCAEPLFCTLHFRFVKLDLGL